MLVFVYGTLRADQPASYYMEGSFPWGNAQTKDKMALFEDGIPMVSSKFAVSRIQGEVYDVDEKSMIMLDRYEGHPGLYERKEFPVLMADGETRNAWIYEHPKPTGNLIFSGEYGSREKVSISWGTSASINAGSSNEFLSILRRSHGSISPDLPAHEFLRKIMQGLHAIGFSENHSPHALVAEMIHRRALKMVANEPVVHFQGPSL